MVHVIGLKRTFCAEQCSFRKACRDEDFVHWQLAKVCRNTPEARVGGTVYNQGLAAEAAKRGKLTRVIESGNLDVIERVPTWTNRYNRVHVASRGNSVAGQYVRFELANLHALVGLSVEHNWLGGLSKLHFLSVSIWECEAPALVGDGAASLSSVAEATYWAT